MPEHLLNIKEVAEYLGVSEEEVKRLVDIGEIPAYQIGDSFLRFRKEQIDAVKGEVSDVEKKDPARIEIKLDAKGRPVHSHSVSRYDYNFVEKVRDFFHYNDFYILSAIVIIILLIVILRS